MLDEKKILEYVASIRKTNKKIVFSNGCFDLLHKGHRDLIKQSFSFGDILILGLNSDESVKRLKGEDRPMQNEIERKNALLNTGYVNEVYIFDDDTPLELINLIKPDILVKGGDYTPNEIVGFEEVTSSGGEIKIVQLTPGFSTTSTIENMR
ncbi:MAG: adenylyltransferase/cytidyltransferase family protein [Candidatus Neomarinimicrobiota bacterium]